MKLTSFRVQNYRSMVDSGCSNLSSDNITILIGQNESGKTTVLEALRSFYSGHISEDIVRSDNTFPEVTCCFALETDEDIHTIIKVELLPNELQQHIESKTSFCLTRKWSDFKNNQLYFDDEKVLDYYQEQQNQVKQKEQVMLQNVEKTIHNYKANVKLLKKLKNNEQAVKKEISENSTYLKKIEKQKNQTEQSQVNNYQKLLENNTHKGEKLRTQIEEIESALEQQTERYKVSLSFEQLKESYINEQKQLEKEMKNLRMLNEAIANAKNIFERRKLKRKIIQARKQIKSFRLSNETLRKELGYKKRLVTKVFDGQTVASAESEIKLEDANETMGYSPARLGNQLFSRIPVFTFFEDFSSLLPDKIDLADLQQRKVQTEGYKAVQNFIKVAGLESSFFELENQRILKQKIENLNGQVTLNFQEYWRQKLGKGNKINLGFDLEHYDDSNPDKKGLPYIEFWIKDNMERLYPKQRSRGVRWFLSFYLELKATASENNRRVLLIDEPGLSLHARAQEDVLKVFEDIKNSVQIIYSTHSPNLIDSNKLYRVLAIQRNFDENDFTSSVIDIANIRKASADTLTPIYSTMGAVAPESSQTSDKSNLIVANIAEYYLLTAMFKLLDMEPGMHIIPSTGLQNIPLLANILLGWNKRFRVLLPDTEEAYTVRDQLLNTVLLNYTDKEDRLIISEGFESLFDVFSTIDFKKYIIDNRIGITETNTAYIYNNDLSINQLSSVFALKVQEETVNLNKLDYESNNNIKKLLSEVNSRFQ